MYQLLVEMLECQLDLQRDVLVDYRGEPHELYRLQGEARAVKMLLRNVTRPRPEIKGEGQTNG